MEIPDFDPDKLVDLIEYNLGQQVYHKSDPDQHPGIVTGIVLRPGSYKYLVVWSTLEDDEHFGFELTTEPGDVTAIDE